MSIIREHIVKRFTRSSKWSKVRKEFVKLYPTCSVCGKKKGLEVHHEIPFHVRPDLELDTNNLVTMCRRHHFAIGHLEYWKAYNGKLIETILYFKDKMRGRL